MYNYDKISGILEDWRNNIRQQLLTKEFKFTRHTLVWILLLIIVIIGIDLRFFSVKLTDIDNPIRADAKDYIFYAYNLRHYGIYSRDASTARQTGSTPKPDAIRSPGYPIYLVPFLNDLPNSKIIWNIKISHVVISTLTIMLAFFAFKFLLSDCWALATAFLVAISPHLVVANIYILTETLYCLFLVLIVLFMIRVAHKLSVTSVITLGLLIGTASLVRPALQYFPVLLAAIFIHFYGLKNGMQKSALLIVGFLVIYTPWLVRNLNTLHVATDDTLVINTIHHGMYPNFIYRDNKKSFGFPYHFDPRSQEISRDIPSILQEVKRRFAEEPVRHIKWYLFGKPVTLWSWNIIQGMGDVFIYPVISTPYGYLPHFSASHSFSKLLHWPLVFLGLAGCVLTWLPGNKINMETNKLLAMRVVAAILLYHTLIHMAGAPFPRYSIPLRPLLYGMALFPLMLFFRSAVASKWLKTRN